MQTYMYVYTYTYIRVMTSPINERPKTVLLPTKTLAIQTFAGVVALDHPHHCCLCLQSDAYIYSNIAISVENNPARAEKQ